MKNSIYILILISAFALLVNVGSYGVLEKSDARYSEISREMFLSGDYLNPKLMDIHHYHKPPVTYQITSLGFELFGLNPFAARFFLQLALLAQLLLIYTLCNMLFNDYKISLWAAMIYFSFPLVLISSRNLTTDPFLTTFIMLSMFSWVKYRKFGKKAFLYLFTLSLALGFLTKGPVVFIVPVVFAMFYNRIERSKNRYSVHHLFAWMLFLLVSSSWFIYLGSKNPDFYNYFIGHHTVDRFSKDVFRRHQPFWFYFVNAPALGVPWLLVLPFLAFKNRMQFSRDRMYLVIVASLVIPFIFLSISSSKLLPYILPLYSLFAILTARLLSEKLSQNSKLARNIVYGIVVLFSLLLILGPFIGPMVDDSIFASKFLMVAGFALLGSIFVLHKTRLFSLNTKSVYASYILSLVIVIVAGHVMATNPKIANSSDDVVALIMEKKLEDRNIIIYNTRKPSFNFGLNKSVISLYDGGPSLNRETQFEEDDAWKQYLYNMKNPSELQQVKELLAKPSVLLIYKYKVLEGREWMLDYYQNKKVIGKYTMYW